MLTRAPALALYAVLAGFHPCQGQHCVILARLEPTLPLLVWHSVSNAVMAASQLKAALSMTERTLRLSSQSALGLASLDC